MRVYTGDFAWWDKEQTLLLISPGILQSLPAGVRLQSILGKSVTTGQDYIDQDTRGGMTAFGFSQTPTTPTGRP